MKYINLKKTNKQEIPSRIGQTVMNKKKLQIYNKKYPHLQAALFNIHNDHIIYTLKNVLS
jgi:hypothetical protein